MRARRASLLLGLGAGLGMLTMPLIGGAAFAHDSLTGSDPASGATVSALGEVALTFSASPLGGEGANVIEVTGPDGRYYEQGCPTLAGPDVTVPVALGPAGRYQVAWRVVSSDGHPVSNSFAFDYAPAPGAADSPGAATPACAAAAPSQPPAETGGAASGVWLGLGIGAVAAVGVGVGSWLLIRRPRGDGERLSHPPG